MSRHRSYLVPMPFSLLGLYFLYPPPSHLLSSPFLFSLPLSRKPNRESRVPKSEAQVANRAIYLYDNRDPYQSRWCFLFRQSHFELALFSDGQLAKVSARPTVFGWENHWVLICTVQHYDYIQHVVVKLEILFALGCSCWCELLLFFFMWGGLTICFARTYLLFSPGCRSSSK